MSNPEIRHGTLKILFTPDEEVGHGVEHVDIKKLGADFAYTMDGESAGNLEDETFSADKATITISRRQRPSRLRQGQDRERDQDRLAHRRPTAEGRLLARDHGRPRGLPAPDRSAGDARRRDAQLHRARLRRERLAREGGAARTIVQEVMRDFPGSTARAENRSAVPQHEGCARPPSAGDRERHGGDPPRRADAAADEHSRRHRRRAAVVHGPALPQHLRRRAHLPLAARMGQRQDMEKAVETIIHLAMIWEEQTHDFAPRGRHCDARIFCPLARNLLGLCAGGRLRVGAAAVPSRRARIRHPSRRHSRASPNGRRPNGTMCGRRRATSASTRRGPTCWSRPTTRWRPSSRHGHRPAITRTARRLTDPAAPR